MTVVVQSAPFFYRLSNGIRITVRPRYIREQSRPSQRQYVFAYHVRIENVGTETATLRTRHWRIHDSTGEDTVVEGEGVIGEQPTLPPGRIHEYRSYCVLRSPRGHMEGEYRFERAGGGTFSAQIPRFELDAEGGARPD